MRKRTIFILVALFLAAFMGGCSPTQGDIIKYRIDDDYRQFKAYRKIAVVNLCTNSVLCEIEGRIYCTLERNGEIAVVAKVGEDQYKCDVIDAVPTGLSLTYIMMEQIEPPAEDPYKYEIRLYATPSELSANQGTNE